MNCLKLGTENNFAKYSPVDIDTLNIAYDYGSVMHYAANAFTSNGLRTIIPKDANAVIGQRVGMSELDILEVQRYYGCSLTPTTTRISSSITTSTTSISSTILPKISLVLLFFCVVLLNND